jgi:hypothetical protein
MSFIPNLVIVGGTFGIALLFHIDYSESGKVKLIH